jgi:hypothetical protein
MSRQLTTNITNKTDVVAPIAESKSTQSTSSNIGGISKPTTSETTSSNDNTTTSTTSADSSTMNKLGNDDEKRSNSSGSWKWLIVVVCGIIGVVAGVIIARQKSGVNKDIQIFTPVMHGIFKHKRLRVFNFIIFIIILLA